MANTYTAGCSHSPNVFNIVERTIRALQPVIATGAIADGHGIARDIRNHLTEDRSQQNSPQLPFPLQGIVTPTVSVSAASLERAELMTLRAGLSARLTHHGGARGFLNNLLAQVDNRLLKLTRTEKG